MSISTACRYSEVASKTPATNAPSAIETPRLAISADSSSGAVAARHVPGDAIAVGFVAYLLLTIAAVTARPGFLQAGADGARPLPAGAGLPIGAVAAFLGVGGSVVTVPLMRRNGHRMAVATALAGVEVAPIAGKGGWLVANALRDRLGHDAPGSAARKPATVCAIAASSL